MIETFDEDIIAGTYRHWIEDVIEGSDGQIEVLPMELYEKFIRLKDERRYLEAKLLLVPLQIRQCKRLFHERVLLRDNTLGEYKTTLKYSSDYGLDLARQMESIF
jgi:hypothetical protein